MRDHFKKCLKKEGFESYMSQYCSKPGLIPYSHTQNLPPKVTCSPMNYALEAEQRMFERAGKAMIVQYER